MEYVTLYKEKKVSVQAYPRDYIHLVYFYIRAQYRGGWRTQHAHRNCSFFFVSVPFFFFFFLNASSSSQGGFSASLRIAATLLIGLISAGDETQPSQRRSTGRLRQRPELKVVEDVIIYDTDLGQPPSRVTYIGGPAIDRRGASRKTDGNSAMIEFFKAETSGSVAMGGGDTPARDGVPRLSSRRKAQI